MLSVSVTYGQWTPELYSFLRSRTAHHSLVGTKLYCLATEAHMCEQLHQGCTRKARRRGLEPSICCPAPYHYATKPHVVLAQAQTPFILFRSEVLLRHDVNYLLLLDY